MPSKASSLAEVIDEPQRAFFMKDQPIFSVEAQVYHMNAKKEKEWKEMSTHAACVHIYDDTARGTYRILSVDGSRPLINVSLTPAVVINRMSKTFVHLGAKQWDIVYGLGFQREYNADVFETKCKELQSKLQTYKPMKRPSSQELIFSDLQDLPPIAASEPIVADGGENQVQLLRAETEQLKSVLAESSATAKLWEIDLQRAHEKAEKYKATLDAVMQLNIQGPGNTQTDFGNPHSTDVPMPRSQPYSQLTSHDLSQDNGYQPTLDLVGPGTAPALIPEEVKSLLEGSSGTHRRFHGNKCENENRTTALKLHKAMGEKLNEALVLHQAMLNFL